MGSLPSASAAPLRARPCLRDHDISCTPCSPQAQPGVGHSPQDVLLGRCHQPEGPVSMLTPLPWGLPGTHPALNGTETGRGQEPCSLLPSRPLLGRGLEHPGGLRLHGLKLQLRGAPHSPGLLVPSAASPGTLGVRGAEPSGGRWWPRLLCWEPSGNLDALFISNG